MGVGSEHAILYCTLSGDCAHSGRKLSIEFVFKAAARSLSVLY